MLIIIPGSGAESGRTDTRNVCHLKCKFSDGKDSKFVVYPRM